MKLLIQVLLNLFLVNTVLSQVHETVYLWPEKIPGQSDAKAPPVFAESQSGKDDSVTRIEKVTNPALIVYNPNSERKNGATVIICPGGGYRRLAIDLEGYEIAEWLSELGYTAFVLQYRVPQNQVGTLQDIQRAIRLVRGTSEERGLDPTKIGVLGFSAGGSLSARASTRYLETLYEPIDELDNLSARPDFVTLIYPAYLDKGANHSLTPELKVNRETPPMFIFVAADDMHANSSLVMSSSLRESNVPFELHILPHGGHGYGMRPGNRSAETWPNLWKTWMETTISKQFETNK
ncbi:alpha/beta hydrolase [Puniceicoccaceae bacterium K14]|nr:alpha/beta hydrolase [Puniceicoccaceae bacterium K14]